MAYNLTNLYSGGPIGYAHQLNVISNYISLDVTLVVLYVVLYGILSGRQASAKNTALLTCWIVFIAMGAFTFGLAASVSLTQAELANYVTRTIFTFALSIGMLLWHLLSD